MFCTNRVKSQIDFKYFLVFPRITCTHHVLFAFPSPKTSIVTHKNSIFFINLSSIFKKRYGSSLIFNVFQVSSPSFLGFCVYVEIWKYGFVDVLMSMIYGFSWFCWYNAYSTCLTCISSFLCIVLCFVLCVHTIFMIKCLLDGFVCLFGFH